MLERVLPGVVRWAEITVDRTDAVSFPEEQDAIARAVDKRHREHTTVWAREALAVLGVRQCILSRQARRFCLALRIVGSMTQRDGRRVRFCATPDTPEPKREAVWNEFLAAGVDHINTEDLAGLQAFPWPRRLFEQRSDLRPAA